MNLDPPEPAPPAPSFAARLGVITFYAALAAAALLLAPRLGVDPWASIHLDIHSLALALIAATPMVAWLILVMTINGLGFDTLRHATVDLVRPLFIGLTPLDIIALSAMAGFVEELLFRGVLQPWATARWNLPTALLATNLLFAAAHALTPTYAALTLLIGAYLGATAAITGNPAVPMIAHALYDAVALAWVIRMSDSGKRDLPEPTCR